MFRCIDVWVQIEVAGQNHGVLNQSGKCWGNFGGQRRTGRNVFKARMEVL